MRTIILTHHSRPEVKYYVNVDKICSYVSFHHGRTFVSFGHEEGEISVVESSEEIHKMITALESTSKS